MGIRHWMVAASLLGAAEAHAGEVGYRVSQGVGYGGLVAAGVGPPVMLIGGLVGVGSAIGGIDNGDADAATTGVLAGVGIILVGQAATTLGAPIMVGGALGGAFNLKSMGATPSTTAGYVGLAGTVVQLAGLAWAISDPPSLENPGAIRPHYLMRFTGWTTALVGAGVQLGENSRAYNQLASAPAPRRVVVQLVPTPRGLGIAGTF